MVIIIIIGNLRVRVRLRQLMQTILVYFNHYTFIRDVFNDARERTAVDLLN